MANDGACRLRRKQAASDQKADRARSPKPITITSQALQAEVSRPAVIFRLKPEATQAIQSSVISRQ
jgi:hypothetical protein